MKGLEPGLRRYMRALLYDALSCGSLPPSPAPSSPSPLVTLGPGPTMPACTACSGTTLACGPRPAVAIVATAAVSGGVGGGGGSACRLRADYYRQAGRRWRRQSTVSPRHEARSRDSQIRDSEHTTARRCRSCPEPEPRSKGVRKLQCVQHFALAVANPRPSVFPEGGRLLGRRLGRLLGHSL